MMRRPLLPLLLLLAGCASAAAEMPLRVMVFNIHAGRDAAGVDNLERVASLIATSEADIVLLQEVDRRTTRSGGADHFAELMRRTGFHGAFGKSLDYQGGEYGIATLSRWPIARAETIPLPVTPAQTRAGGAIEPRVALVVETLAPRGAIRVINTHLDASREEHYRLQEVEHLLRRLPEGTPLLAGGDFNAEPGSGVHARMREGRLRDAWVECAEGGDGLTFPAKAPVKRIDYLFLDGARCTSALVLSSEASDHRPLVVSLTIR